MNTLKETLEGYKLPVLYESVSAYERRAVREQYIKIQKGLCYWCNGPLIKDPPEHIKDMKINWSLFPKNFLKYPVHLQHDHKSGLTEGAVHAKCNAVMWQYHKR